MDAPLTTQTQFVNLIKTESSEKANDLTSINNYLNLKLSKLVNHQSFIYSPFSITYLILFLYLGSMGETKKQLADLFGINNSNKDDQYIMQLYELSNELMESEFVIISNGYFLNSKFHQSMKDPFVKLINQMGFVKSCDFKNKHNIITKTINKWISTNTFNIINNVITKYDINAYTELVGINVIYFRGEWLYNFNKHLTKINKFTNHLNHTSNLLFMNQINTFNYFENKNLQMIELPYKFKQFVFGIVLPKDNNPLTENYYHYVHKLVERNVNISLPKFIKRQHLKLRKPLEIFGCKRMFDEANAEFYNMIDTKDILYVNQLYQDVVLIVDENGDLNNTNNSNPLAVRFNANHTFYYYVRHVATDTIIIHGCFDG